MKKSNSKLNKVPTDVSTTESIPMGAMPNISAVDRGGPSVGPIFAPICLKGLYLHPSALASAEFPLFIREYKHTEGLKDIFNKKIYLIIPSYYYTYIYTLYIGLRNFLPSARQAFSFSIFCLSTKEKRR